MKQTVELMGGTIEVESKVGEGTEYTIMLPFKIDPDPHVEQRKIENISLKGVRALLVEDNDLNLEIAKFHLEQEDIEVFTAVNGLEATRRIRVMERADAFAIPIIAMSANAFEEDIQLSLEAGLNEHLIKPLDGKKVTDTMKKFLANKIR